MVVQGTFLVLDSQVTGAANTLSVNAEQAHYIKDGKWIVKLKNNK
ncbi:MAG: hypothetical protein ACI9YH_001380 [Colwellia sp.]|jgi:hypothetical protein